MCDTVKIIIDAVSAAIALGALVVSVWQYIKNSKRKKNEDTIYAYEKLQCEVFSKLNVFLNRYRKDDNKVDLSDLKKCTEDWEKLTNFLTRIEVFSTGVNTGIYDFEIVKRIGGAYIIKRYTELKTLIRSFNGYYEFTELCAKIMISSPHHQRGHQ